jgi:hypothetical protein
MEVAEGAKLIVADASQASYYRRMGYTEMGDYTGSGFEGGKKSYYFSAVSGNAAFSQGAMQSVSTAINGVDPRSGRNVTGSSGGRLSDGQFLRAKKRIAQGLAPVRGEPVTPVFDASGQIIAYERSMSADMLALRKPNDQLLEMTGAWAGRQAEEEMSRDYNEQLIDEAKRVYDRDRLPSVGKASDFVNIADEDLDDGIWKDAWAMIPAESKAYITEVFGKDTFMVRRDMVDNMLGYRAPSVSEFWDGATRLSEGQKKAFVDVAELMMGDKAYRNFVTAEKLLQAGVSVAKSTIVVKSLIVPMANLMSDFVQLMSLGVPLRDIVRGYRNKLVEINQYVASQKRKAELSAEIAAARGSKVQRARRLKFEAELAALEESNKRMSIWPLIEAGEFTTISEGLTQQDAALSGNKWSEYMANLIERAPSKLGVAGRYAVIARDTALFKGMDRMVQYGSFISKAVAYDDMIGRQEKTSQQGLNRVTEEFVNYTLLPSRARAGLESNGMLWFWNYKMRSIKVAHRLLRDNPVRALMMTSALPYLPGIPGVSVGGPLSDNAINIIAEGRADNAVGIGQLFSAPGMIPWVNFTN